MAAAVAAAGLRSNCFPCRKIKIGGIERGVDCSSLCLHNNKGQRKRGVVVVRAGIQIDRKRHLEESLKRQQDAAAREAEAEISCPVDCIRVVHNLAEFDKILKRAEEDNDLVVVDFYNSSCGACKYMLPQFIKLCKRGCTEECLVEEEQQQCQIVFVKHNVLDDYDELTDFARLYSISTVPMFAIFKHGSLVEKFATRDKHRLEQSICRLLENHSQPRT